MISVNSLSKSFNEVKAVSSLTFDVKQGEIFGIVGPDGAGKSTLLRMLSAILVPDSGVITMKGDDIFHNTYATKERIAYMPQRFGLYEDLTVEENIFFFGRLFGLKMKEIKAKLPVLYKFSSLEPFRERLAGNLSGGMKQKLGLACCLVHNPEVILLDEPTNGVDPVSRREFWRILYGLLTDGVTIIISTAYLDEAERCSRIALMYNGSFINIGEPKIIKSMVEKPLIEIICGNARKGELILKKTQQFGSVSRTGESLKLFVQNKRRDSNLIKKELTVKGISIKTIREIEPSLEDIFIEVITMKKGAA